LGTPKRASYEVGLGGRKGLPYLNHTKRNIPDTPGFEPVEVNVELERGLEITGKVIDRTTGKPVPGRVSYLQVRDNPFLKDFMSLEFAMRVGDWGKIQPDGTYTVLGFPGPGVLVVFAADSTCYPRIDNKAVLSRLGSTFVLTNLLQAAERVDPRE